MIYFVRHGSTDWNDNKNERGERDPKCQGRIDLPLNSKGIGEAKETAKMLKGVHFDRVIVSPLLRAKQTCEIVYSGIAKAQIDERVIERDFGEFEGLTRSQFDFYGFWNKNATQKYQKAETLSDVEKRVFSLLDELKQKPNENVLIVSHGGVGCIFMSYFKGVPEDGNYMQYLIPNGKPLIIEF